MVAAFKYVIDGRGENNEYREEDSGRIINRIMAGRGNSKAYR